MEPALVSVRWERFRFRITGSLSLMTVLIVWNVLDRKDCGRAVFH